MSDVLTAQLASNEQLVTAIKGTDGALHVANQAVEPGHDSTFNRVNTSNKASAKYALTGTGQVGTAGQRTYKGARVTTALSAAAITLYDGTAASGTVIGVIPASSAAGYNDTPPCGVPCSTGVYASFAGTGTVLFLVDESV